MKVLVSGGGTGGHIYPALAIIREIKNREPASQFLFIGTSEGLEADIVQKAGIPFETIHITGFKRKHYLDNVKTIYHFMKGVVDSKRKIRAFKPDIVIGTGGYVSGPVVFAASRLKIPTLIHEQNVVPGLANAFLSRFTSAVAVSFEASSQHFKHSQLLVTGNPRASEVVQADGQNGRASLSISDNKKVILIVGGSRGAQAINEAFLDMVEHIGQLPHCHFIYVTGDVHYEEVRAKLIESKVLMEKITLRPFLYNMPDVLAGTDLIVNRAGASFLAEVTALGLPSILIPSPYVTNNHQEKNARWLEQEGASIVILEKDLSGTTLFEHIKCVIDDEDGFKKMKVASLSLGKKNAATDIYHLMKSLVGNH